VLCDDDLLFPHSTLIASYTLAANPDTVYGVGFTYIFNDELAISDAPELDIMNIFKHEFNRPVFVKPSDVYNKQSNLNRLETATEEELNEVQPVVDISQLIFRCDIAVANGIWWEDKQNAYLDFEFVGKLYRKYGLPMYIPAWLHYKRIHSLQLGKLEQGKDSFIRE